MSDYRFRELINLFLDEEMSVEERQELDGLLRIDPARRLEFESRCRLHRAMRLALLSPSQRASTERAVIDISTQHSRRMKLGLLGAGMAASFVFGVLLTFLFAVQQSQKAVETSFVEAESESFEWKARRLALSEVSRSAEDTGSVAAHLRLLGLRPGMQEATPQLREVDLVAQAESRAARMEQIERLSQERLPSNTFSQPVIFSGAAQGVGAAYRLPDGFDVSLASFK